MPERRAIGHFAPGTWVRRAVWASDHRGCVVASRDELVALIEELDPDVASTARVSTGENFPVLVEAYGLSLTWTDELCVSDAIATDWLEAPWPTWARLDIAAIEARAHEFDNLFEEPVSRRKTTDPYR